MKLYHSLNNIPDPSDAPFYQEITSQYREVLKTLFSDFPSDITSFYGLELHLNNQIFEPDFLVCISKLNASRLKAVLATDSLQNSGIPGFKKFADRWSDNSDLLRFSINNIWLEFDRKDILQGSRKANFFYGPSHGTCPVTSAQQVFEVLNGRTFPSELITQFEKCKAALPANAWMAQVGMMLARNDESIRVFIYELKPAEIISYLEKLHYPFLSELFETLMDQLESVNGHFGLDIDINKTLGATIGIECYAGASEPNAYKQILQLLFSNNYLTGKGGEWLKQIMHSAENTSSNPIRNMFHHVKLVHKPGEDISSKLYLRL
jgi:hypothetical protein